MAFDALKGNSSQFRAERTPYNYLQKPISRRLLTLHPLLKYLHILITVNERLEKRLQFSLFIQFEVPIFLHESQYQSILITVSRGNNKGETNRILKKEKKRL